MKLEDHLLKHRRFDAVGRRMSPVDQFELWYWMVLSAGTAIINAALHAAGLTDENDCFATQVPDVYARVAENGSVTHVLARRCDLIHIGLPAVEGPLPANLQDAYDAMEVIERYRDPCIRGDLPVTDGVRRECAQAYARLVEACRAQIAVSRPTFPARLS